MKKGKKVLVTILACMIVFITLMAIIGSQQDEAVATQTDTEENDGLPLIDKVTDFSLSPVNDRNQSLQKELSKVDYKEIANAMFDKIDLTVTAKAYDLCFYLADCYDEITTDNEYTETFALIAEKASQAKRVQEDIDRINGIYPDIKGLNDYIDSGDILRTFTISTFLGDDGDYFDYAAALSDYPDGEVYVLQLMSMTDNTEGSYNVILTNDTQELQSADGQITYKAKVCREVDSAYMEAVKTDYLAFASDESDLENIVTDITGLTSTR